MPCSTSCLPNRNNVTVCFRVTADQPHVMEKVEEQILESINAFNRNLSTQPTDDVGRAVHALMNALHQQGATLVSAKKKCILLDIQCTSLQDLSKLLKMCGNRLRLKGIENALAKTYKEDISVEMVLSEDSIELISEWIDEQLSIAKRTILATDTSAMKEESTMNTDEFAAALSLDRSDSPLDRGRGSTEIDVLRPASVGDEEQQSQLAMTSSLEEHDERLPKQEADDIKLQTPLDESRRHATHEECEEIMKRRASRELDPKEGTKGKALTDISIGDEDSDVMDRSQNPGCSVDMDRKDVAKFYTDVLNKATVAIVDNLEPKGLLDVFVQRNILGEATNRKIRDITEIQNTSDQNRAIRILVRRSGNYVIFKEGLASTGQQQLLHVLEEIELEMHDLLKESHHCDSAESCPLLQHVKHQQLKISTQTSKSIPELQQHLISMYKEDNKYWKSPVTHEQAFLSEMYVQPSVKCIREINEHGTFVEVKEQNTQPSKLIYKDLFETKTGGLCKNMYVTGKAGAGKSTFCNQLVCNWCSVKNKSDNNLSSEDQNLLSSFSLLFHINLRDCETVYRVEDMIKEQLLSIYSGEFNISDILRNERCLIVLDGLDEWSCPDNAKKCPKINKHIPGRNTENKKCVFITTSRNWKYDVIALENKDRDKQLELIGINRDESVELAKKMLDHLDIEKKSIKKADTFFSEIKEKKLNEFLSVPVLLIQLITLWFFGKDLGNSQLQLYCSMLDLLFERSEKNLPEEISKCSSTTVATPKQLPECLSTKLYCKKYTGLLHCLAELAYKALFNKQKEEALVFKRETLDILGISPPDITLCLQCGILSQCKDYDKRYGKYKKFSFLHKKVQEYFAALYLVTNDNVEDNLKEVKQFCNSVETMLEMNQVWLFVAGMDPDMTRRLFECLGDVVSGDELVKTYRQTLDHEYTDSGSLVLRIQDCVSDCVSEGINNGHHYENLCLEDFYINEYNDRDVERLVCYDMSKVKSVYIGTGRIDAAKVAAITGQFLQCRSLQRLYLHDWEFSLIPESTVTALVKNNCDSLTSLNLWTEIKATDKLVTAICSSISKSLMALRLYRVKLTHEHIEQILHSLSQSPAIRQLELRLDCTDHRYECRARIDWSALSQLKKLTLWTHMYVDNLQSLPHSVEEVVLFDGTLAVTSLREFALGLSKTRRAVDVRLVCVTLTETREECGDLEGFLHSCPGLVVTKCKYYDDTDSDDTHSDDTAWWYNTWDIEFHTNSQ